RHLERGPAVAEEIVGGAQPRAEILPVRRVPHLGEITRRDVWASREMLCRNERVVQSVPHAYVERELPNGPLILSVDTVFRCGVKRPVWGVVDGDLIRHPVPETVRDGLVDEVHIGVALSALTEVIQIDPDSDVVRASDVGHAESFVPAFVVQYLV